MNATYRLGYCQAQIEPQKMGVSFQFKSKSQASNMAQRSTFARQTL